MKEFTSSSCWWKFSLFKTREMKLNFSINATNKKTFFLFTSGENIFVFAENYDCFASFSMTHKKCDNKQRTRIGITKKLNQLKGKSSLENLCEVLCLNRANTWKKEEKWLSHGAKMVLCGVLKIMLLLLLPHKVTQMSYFMLNKIYESI